MVPGGRGWGLVEPWRVVGAVLLRGDGEGAVEVARVRCERRVPAGRHGPHIGYRPPRVEALGLGLLGDVLGVLDVVVDRRRGDTVALELEHRLFDRRRRREGRRTTEVAAIDGARRDPDRL